MPSPKQPLGITFSDNPFGNKTGVYEAVGGVEVFETDQPYILNDGVSLQPPLSVFDAGGPIFLDALGNAQAALAVVGLPSPDGDMWLLTDGTWNDAGVWKDAEAWKDS